MHKRKRQAGQKQRAESRWKREGAEPCKGYLRKCQSKATTQRVYDDAAKKFCSWARNERIPVHELATMDAAMERYLEHLFFSGRL